MLGLCQIQRLPVKSFTCWQCRAKRSLSTPKESSRKWSSVRYKNRLKVPRRHFSINYTNVGSTRPGDPTSLQRQEPVLFERNYIDPDFRKRLKEWEIENSSSNAPPQTLTGQELRPGDVVNLVSKSGGGTAFEVAPASAESKYQNDSPSSLDIEGSLGSGNVWPGDMVALGSTGREQEMAIFVRNLETQSQYYTMSGRYVHIRSRKSNFSVPRFVEPSELEEIKACLPELDLPQTLEGKLQDIKESVPRHIGRPLLQKMTKFWQEAQAIFQTDASRLDNAHNILAHQNRFRYGTLEELAEELLSSDIPREADGSLSMPVLLAVHQSLTLDDSGIRVQNHGSLGSSSHYEISSIREMQNNARVVEEVRKYRDDVLSGTRNSLLHGFVQKATKLVDKSRKFREFTSHGTLGPSSRKSLDPKGFRNGTVCDEFNTGEEIFPMFIESWAGLSTFGRSSTLNGIGSAILRAVGRYKEEFLDPRTGWTFLQEIGYIPPWQTAAPYGLRVPLTGRRLRIERAGTNKGYISDKLSHIRKDWGNDTVFCIDGTATVDIDDGVSLERTENLNEYWVHIHIADPSSHLEPGGEAALLAESLTENFYMQDRVVNMLNSEIVQSKLSLAPHTPCLTFSAKMNLEGDILDTRVTAGKIKNVVYMTPEVFDAFKISASNIEYITHKVGPSLFQTSPSRVLVEREDLSTDQILTLKTLHHIAAARDNQMIMKGAFHHNTIPSPEVAVSFEGAQWEKPDRGNASRQYHGDPSIQVTVPLETDQEDFNYTSGSSTVSRLMLVANEVAARWCHARGIPIPYRVSQPSPGNMPLEYFNSKILPVLQKGASAPSKDILEYFSLIGEVRTSATPGRHIGVGADLIAKCTSPLRRYGDLLLHWQVGAALLHEATTGTSLVGNTKDDFLPFSKTQMQEKMPRLRIRERQIQLCKRQASTRWMCHFLLRAWKFKEAVLPSPLRFRALDVTLHGVRNPEGYVLGTLTDFAFWVTLECLEGETKADIEGGMEFAVEIVDVDTYLGTVTVRKLRRWGEEEIQRGM